jgi:CheY-like chemotaxis protein
VSYPCGSFCELETVVLSDIAPCKALAVYRDFPADRHASAIHTGNKVGPPDFVENAPQNGALTTASIEKTAFDVRPGCEGRLLENDDPAGRRQSISAARKRTSTVKAGYDVVSVVDGEAALLMARERIPNLILLDMMLPKLDGLASGVIQNRPTRMKPGTLISA